METEYDYNFHKPKRFPDWLAIVIIAAFVLSLLGVLWYILDSIVN
jgi:hypothetical protein